MHKAYRDSEGRKLDALTKLERSGYGIPRICSGIHDSVDAIIKCKPCAEFLDSMTEAPKRTNDTWKLIALGFVLVALMLLASYGDTISGINPAGV